MEGKEARRKEKEGGRPETTGKEAAGHAHFTTVKEEEGSSVTGGQRAEHC